MFLAVETSGPNGGLALVQNDKIVDEMQWTRATSFKNKGSSHSELITVNFQKLLAQNNISQQELHGLIVSQGPGSFTGIRVAINFVKSLAYSLDLPIFAYNSLATMPYLLPLQHTENSSVICLLNAFKNMVYLATYHLIDGRWHEKTPPKACEIQRLETEIEKPHIILGDGLKIYGDSLPSGFRHALIEPDQPVMGPSVQGLVQLYCSETKSESTPRSCSTLSWKELQPLYLRASSAEENLEKGVLKPLS